MTAKSAIESQLKRLADLEVENRKLRLVCEDKERHLDGYRREADEDRAENQRLQQLVRDLTESLHRGVAEVTDLEARCDRLAAALRSISDAAGPIVRSERPGRAPLTPVEVRGPSGLIVEARELLAERRTDG